MYGGMGGGGNAWMKIMGIGEKDAKNRNKNKKSQDPNDPINIGR